MLPPHIKVARIARRAIVRASVRLLARALVGREGVAISVVIATRNRASYLELTLASLERQVFPYDRWEIIVADHASLDDTPEIINRYISYRKMQLRCWRSETPQNSSTGRNRAIELARGKIVVFLGDDQIAAPDLLIHHLRCHMGGPICVIGETGCSLHTHLFPPQGCSIEGVLLSPVMTPADLDAPRTWEMLIQENDRSYSSIWHHFTAQKLSPPHPWTYVEGGNISVSRELLLSQGCFDEGYPTWDLGEWGLAYQDLALRLHEKRVPIRFEPNAITWQQIGPESGLDERKRISNITRFFSLHPSVDRTLVE